MPELLRAIPETRNGIPGHLFPDHGRWLPVVSGGSEDEPLTPPAPLAPPAPLTPPTPPVLTVPDGYVPQTEINRVGTAEHARGKKAAREELLRELGVADLKDAKTVLDAVKVADEAQKTEAQRAVEAANAREAAAVAREHAADAREKAAAITGALISAGIADATQRNELVPMVAAKLTDDTDAAAAVEAIKATFPQLFAAPAGQTPAPSGDPRNPTPPAPVTGTSAWDAGIARAAAVNESATTFDPYSMIPGGS